MEDKDLKQEPDNRPEEAIEPEAVPDAVPAENAEPIAEAESAPSCGEAAETAEAPSDMSGDEPPVEELSAEEQAKITAAQQRRTPNITKFWATGALKNPANSPRASSR